MPTFTGDDGGNTLTGTSENDVLIGNGGSDILIGGLGDDDLRGGSGEDILVGGLATVEFVFPFANLFSRLNVNALRDGGADIYDGGADTDIAILTYSNTSGAIVFDNSQVGPLNPITVAGANAGSVTNVERITFFSGTGDDRITGGSEHDILYGGGGNDILSGEGGVDHLIGGAGNDTLRGGQGLDLAVYSGPRRLYQVGPNQVSGYLDGVDALQSIETIRFVDGYIAFGADTGAAQAMRLHIAALDRQPESQARFSALADLHGAGGGKFVASSYTDTPEFLARYGGLSNQQFVETLYRFCMDREGEPAGVANWTGLLNNGLSRAQVLFEFSDSPEFRALTADVIAAGLFVENQAALSVARLFDAAFDTLPDAASLGTFTALLFPNALVFQPIQRGLFEIAETLVASAAFQERYGSLSNREFIEQLYRLVLDRNGEPAGLAYWIDQLDRGQLRSQVLVHFSESAEHVALTRPLWQGGIRTLDETPPVGAVGLAHAPVSLEQDLFVAPSVAHFLPSQVSETEAAQAAPETDATWPVMSRSLAVEPDLSQPEVAFDFARQSQNVFEDWGFLG